MKLKYVTITGADDNIDWRDLLKLSKEFPFVEWGILLSSSNEGKDRFPSRDWFLSLPLKGISDLSISFHLCGRLSKTLLQGEITDGWEFNEWFGYGMYDRLQINTNLKYHKINEILFIDRLRMIQNIYSGVQFITQLHSGNGDTLWKLLSKYHIRNHVLFDSSGGRGDFILNGDSPELIGGMFCGFAGGINTVNIEHIVDYISTMCKGICWIDMESGVRDENNKLDLDKVYTILKACEPYVL